MTLPLLLLTFGFGAMGLVGLLAPDRIPRLFGMGSPSPDARNEVRAVYGGFGLALAGWLLFAARSGPLREGTLLTVSLLCLGMAVGRLVGALIEKPGRWPRVFFLVEIAAALLAWYAARIPVE